MKLRVVSGVVPRTAALAVSFLTFSTALGQTAMSQPDEGSSQIAASAPAAGANAFVFEVVGVQGKVRIGDLAADPNLDAGWTQIRLGDQVTAGHQIKVGLRSKVKMVMRPETPPTLILIDRSTVVQVDELALVDGAARTRLDLKYGGIKGGVAEGETRSDLTIQSPSAMLSKRGTDIFGFDVRPDGRFNMYLTAQGRGMLQTIITQAGAFGSSRLQSRFLTPGQWITDQMVRAIDTVQFDRKVMVSDVFGLSNVDQLFTMINDRGGFGFLLPPGTNNAAILGNNPQGGPQFNLFGNQNQNQAGALLTGTRNFGGGDFGIGQGSVPSVFSGARMVRPVRLRNTLRDR